MARRWADVAELIATQGLKGRFVARSVHGLPFLLEEGMQVAFVPPTLDGPRTATVTSVQHAGSGEYHIEFNTVKNRDMAELVVGSHCLAHVSDLPENYKTLSSNYAETFVGYAVVDDAYGKIGTIARIQANPAHDLLVIAQGSSEVLIPLVPEFVQDIDDDQRCVYMSLPSGLVELNA